MSVTRHAVLIGACSLAVVAAAGLAVAPTLTAAQSKVSPVFTDLVRGVAVGGYDPVTYFTEGRPTRGSPEIVVEHGGATWRFASAANRKAFRADPAKYAPQFGGYCAWAVAEGYTAKGDPTAWSIVDGKLYLNYDKSVQRTWEKASRANITRGVANWPKLVRQ